MARGLVINNNISSLNILNTMNYNIGRMRKSMVRLSTGMKINGAADDPSGFFISEKMRVQIRCMEAANRNTQTNIALLKTAEGALQSTIDIIRSMKEKALNAANGTNTENELRAIQQELDQMIDQVTENSNITFNDKFLLDGSLGRRVENPTKNVLANDRLAADTTGNTLMTDLNDYNGNQMNIVSGDKLTLSYVINGQTTTTSMAITDATTLNDVFALAGGFMSFSAGTSFIGTDASGQSVYFADGRSVLTVTAASGGLAGAIAGLTIGVTDRVGKVKSDVNKLLDSFSEKISPKNRSVGNGLYFQTGTKPGEAVIVGIGDMSAAGLGLQGNDASGTHNINVMTPENAKASISVIDQALSRALEQQTGLGATRMRLEHTYELTNRLIQYLKEAESNIRDADMAKETLLYTKYKILSQVSQAMLAQSNQQNHDILSLLQ